MRALPLARCGLLLVLMTSPALARDLPDNLTIRTLTVPCAPGRDAPYPVFVSGQVVTTFRFETEVDPTKTKLVGWEGRFEPPLIGGKKVVLEPLHNLGIGDALPLLVRLVDGTEFTFLVKAKSFEATGWVDVQLNVFKYRDSYDAVLSSLYDSQNREQELRDENEQLKEQVSSIDSSLAMLLANGEEEQTGFRRRTIVRPKDAEMEIGIELYGGVGKAAALVQFTNTHLDARWKLDRAYLTRDSGRLSPQSFALRMDQPVIAPGDSGKIAVVVDKSAFVREDGQLVDLALQLIGDDGVQRVEVAMKHTLILPEETRR